MLEYVGKKLVMVALWISLGVIGGLLLFVILPLLFISIYVYRLTLVRTSLDKWGRTCSALDNKEQVEMYDKGLTWEKENYRYKKEVTITSFDNLKLVGEYFDFGYSKAVIIVQGRTESLLYCYYYAAPYKDAGYNILVVDPRAHGLSEGRYTSVGFNESNDILGWTNLLVNQYKVKEIIYHGICIGGATCLYAANSKECPDEVKGLITDGLFTTFYETYVNHMKDEHHPVFPVARIVFSILKLKTGANARKYGPINAIKEYRKPLLMIASKQDVFSLQDKTQLLFDTCPSNNKTLKFFDKGAHSHVRINQEKEYDEQIVSFLKQY